MSHLIQKHQLNKYGRGVITFSPQLIAEFERRLNPTRISSDTVQSSTLQNNLRVSNLKRIIATKQALKRDKNRTNAQKIGQRVTIASTTNPEDVRVERVIGRTEAPELTERQENPDRRVTDDLLRAYYNNKELERRFNEEVLPVVGEAFSIPSKIVETFNNKAYGTDNRPFAELMLGERENYDLGDFIIDAGTPYAWTKGLQLASRALKSPITKYFTTVKFPLTKADYMRLGPIEFHLPSGRAGMGTFPDNIRISRFEPHIPEITPETSSFRTFNPQREGFPLYGLPIISDPSKIVFNIPKGKLTLGELSEIKSGIDSLIKNGSTQMQTANGFKIAYSPQYKIFGILRGNFMTNSRILDSYFDKHLAPLRIQYPKERLVGETPKQILERITDTSLPYGYDIEEMVKLAQTEFNPQNLAFSRPVLDYLIRNSRDKETLSRALNMVLNGESKSKFGQGFLTLMSPTPDLVLQATYMDLSGRGYPLYGAGYVSSGPIAEGLNPLLGTYRGGNFGDYVSVTNNLLGGGKYGHTNFPELRNYLRTIDINPEGLLSIEQLMKRIEDFENNPRYKGKNFGKTEVNADGIPNNGTVNGLISDKGRKDPAYSQYLRDRELLLLKLSGLMDYGAKNLQIVFRAPYLEDMAFTRTNKAPIGLNQTALYSVYDYNGFPLYDTSGNLIWKSNIQNLERGISKRYPGKHLWYVGPNPHEGMITFQASGIKPVLKEGGLIKKLLKNNLRHGKIHKNN